MGEPRKAETCREGILGTRTIVMENLHMKSYELKISKHRISKFPISHVHGTEDCAPDSAPMWGSKAGKLLFGNII